MRFEGLPAVDADVEHEHERCDGTRGAPVRAMEEQSLKNLLANDAGNRYNATDCEQSRQEVIVDKKSALR